jgi:hypothetical protein
MEIIETITKSALCFIEWIFSVEGSQVIYNLGLGMGGIIGSLAGSKVIKDWMSQKKRESLIDKYSKKYPHELFNVKERGWELTNNPFTPGDIYILDHRSRTKHWIANYQTFLDLPIPKRNFQLTEEKSKLFNKYEKKAQILTTGRPEPS